MVKRRVPNVVSGGVAIPLKNKTNYYYMAGRKHSQGGIDIGKNPLTGLEVEDGEVMHVADKEIKVFSSVPFLNGISPAQKVMGGENPTKVFNQQESYKDKKGLNDDGTKKKQNGGKTPNRRKYTTALNNNEEKQFQSWYSKVAKYKNLNPNPDADGQDYDYRGYWKNEDRNGILGSNPNAHFTDKYKQPTHPTFSNESQYSNNETPGGTWVKGKGTWLFKHNKYTARQAKRTADYLNGTGEGYILGTDTIIPNRRKKMGGLNRKQDYGSKSKPYPKVKTGDFAGSGRSYPITTKDDAVDALRLAGLHGRSDVKAKVYSKYPELRKKSKAGGIYSLTSNGKTTLHLVPSTGKDLLTNRTKATFGIKSYIPTHGSYSRMTGIPRAVFMMNNSKNTKSKKEDKFEDIEEEFNNEEYTNNYTTNIEKPAPIKGVKTYHNIAPSSKIEAVKRAIGRRTGYNFTKHGNTDFRIADLENAIFTNRPDTIEHISSIYGNDFVARDNAVGSSRKASEFKKGSPPIDNKIPIEKISRYYGNKNGKFIIGSLDDFDDNDYIAAIRNKSMLFDNVDIINGELIYYMDGKPIESSLPKGEKQNNKHIIYSPKTGKTTFVSTTKDINKLYEFYKQFLIDNEIADIAMLDNGRFEDNIYKDGRNLTDEEISDYYRNDFNRKGAFTAVPVLIERGRKRFGGKQNNKRNKALLGTEDNKLSYTAMSLFGPKYDKVVDIDLNSNNITERTLDYADPVRPNKSYMDLIREGYFTGYGISGFNNRRVPYVSKPVETEIKKDIIETPSITTPATTYNKTNATINNKRMITNTDGLKPKGINIPISNYKPMMNKVEPKTFNPIKSNLDKQEDYKDNWFKRNSDNIIDAIGLTSNVVGGLISHSMNRNMLNRLKYNSQPIARTPAKLKTKININPQLDKMRETLAAYERDIDTNTASSRVALARKQRGRLANMMNTNELYADKENKETALINQDKLNQQSVAAENIKDYNAWRKRKAAFENAVREKKAENDVSLINTINQGVQDVIGRREKRRRDNNTIVAMADANPHLPLELFYEQGLINNKTYKRAIKMRNTKKNKKD